MGTPKAGDLSIFPRIDLPKISSPGASTPVVERVTSSVSRKPPPWAALIVLAGVAGLAVYRVVAKRQKADAPATPLAEPRTDWDCECGQTFRVAGEGRHRIFWLADAPEEDPVMSGRCPNCDRDLLETASTQSAT